MIGLTSLEVYISAYNITEEINKFECYTAFFHELSFTELKDELAKILGFPDISLEHLQDKILGPCIIEAHLNFYQKSDRVILLLKY